MVTTSRRSTAPLILLLVALLGATVLGAYHFSSSEPSFDDTNKTVVTIEPGQPLRVTFVGDSLDAGLYATDPGRGFHPLMVEAWRSGGPVSDTPLNSLGGTANDALGNTDLPGAQELVVVELGTNDVARQDHHHFRQDYEQLLDRLRTASPNAGLLCVGPWRPVDTARRFDTIIKDLCEARGGVFRSISDIAENAEMKGPAGVATSSGLSDNFHPNDLGHRAIADRLLGAVAVRRQS